jgi:adenosylcobinamide kinase/adenosylcobinamide-phosphate guanylyltransferase
VTGGSRSGKTSYALERARRFSCRIYLATAEAIDDEMRLRISRHRQERGEGFQTIEEPLDLAGALHRIPDETEVVLIDCLTVWLGNLMHRKGVQSEPYTEERELLRLLKSPPCNIIIVTNELGSGIVPADAMTRSFRDHTGWLNQDIARIADEVVLVVCGLPLVLKG